MIPQCGFSVAAANLYATGIITLGTLMAIFLSTSDEMLPILISGGAGAALIVQILGIKVIFAIASGVLLDIFLPQKFIRHKQEPDIEAFCQREKCKCDDKENIWHSAYKHTEKSAFSSLFSLLSSTPFCIWRQRDRAAAVDGNADTQQIHCGRRGAYSQLLSIGIADAAVS